jgi:hypothetical protein
VTLARLSGANGRKARIRGDPQLDPFLPKEKVEYSEGRGGYGLIEQYVIENSAYTT